MPIEIDSGNIDFVWKNSPSQEQESISYSLRFHKTAEFGASVSFLDNENKVVFTVPADFFPEVSEYISQYRNSVKKSQVSVKNSTVPGLQLPRINGKTPANLYASKELDQNVMTAPDGRRIIIDDKNDITGEVISEEIFIPPGHDPSSVKFDPNDPVFQSFNSQSSSTESIQADKKIAKTLSEEEILIAREKAKNNPNKKIGIKKRHTE
jgi:hypothetical protein